MALLGLYPIVMLSRGFVAPHKESHVVNRYKLRFIVPAVLILTSLLSAQTNLAIIPFDAKGVSDIEAGLLTDHLGLELSMTGLFTVLEQRKMDSILTKHNFQMANCVSEECLVEAGRLLDVEQIIGGIVVKAGNTYSMILWLIDTQSGAIVQLISYDHQGTLAQLWSPGMGVVASRFAGQLVEPDRQSIPVDDQKVALAARPTRRVRKGDLYFFPKLGIGHSGWPRTGLDPSVWGNILSTGGQWGYGPILGGKLFGDVLVMYDDVIKRVNSLNVVALYELQLWIFYGQGGIGYISDQGIGGFGIRAGGGIEIPIGKKFRLRPALEINYGKKSGQSSYALNLNWGFKFPGVR